MRDGRLTYKDIEGLPEEMIRALELSESRKEELLLEEVIGENPMNIEMILTEAYNRDGKIRNRRELLEVAMKPTYYTVHAYRWGDREMHSYSVGLYSKKHAALKAAEAEAEWRGGKYECEVIEWIPDGKNEDGSPGMPHKIIKPLPPVNTLKTRGS